jgi:hypothetical protein
MFEAGQVVTLRGVVSRNVRACEVDGPCFLEMRGFLEMRDRESSGAESLFTVLYAEPRGLPCPNEAAIRQGLATEAGNEIEVQGLATGPNRLTTCDSDESFIRKTTDRGDVP